MALKSHSPSMLIFYFFLVSSTCSGASATFSGRKASGVSTFAESPKPDIFEVELDAKDPKVIELAKFAVDEHNKESRVRTSFEDDQKLSLGGVRKAYNTNKYPGYNYLLGFEGIAVGIGYSDYYVAGVLMENGVKELVLFEALIWWQESSPMSAEF